MDEPLMKFETNLPLRDTFHELNQVMDKVDYQGNRYVFESDWLNGTLLQGNLQAGLEFRLSEVLIKRKALFVRRPTEALRWYLDINKRPTADDKETITRVNFHNRKEAGSIDMLPADIIGCNFQIAPSVLQPFYLGKYEHMQEVMESGEPVNLSLPALPGTGEVIRRCLDLRLESVLHSRILHNRVEGLFLAHLSMCWDELSKQGT